MLIKTNVEEGRKESFLFNDALNTFYLRLYDVGYMIKDHSDSEKGNPLQPHGLLFQISSKECLTASAGKSILQVFRKLKFNVFKGSEKS